MPNISRALFQALLCITFSTAAMSAAPSPGVWGIDGEINGKPGRGFQFDTQGADLLIVTYFGYRADGSALFLQAIGVQKDSSFEGELVEYKGGPVLGGVRRDGESAGSAGRIVIAFDSTTTGSVTLPGEGAKRISRFQYEDNSVRFNHEFTVAVNNGYHSELTVQQFSMTAKNGLLTMGQIDSRCQYAGTYEPSGLGLKSTGNFICNGRVVSTYRTEDLVVDAFGALTGRVYRTPPGGQEALVEVYFGVCSTSLLYFHLRTRCSFNELHGIP